MSKKGTNNQNNNIAENRKARYNYTLLDEYEAGIVLKGSEVKSLRNSSANIAESFVEIQNNELWLINCYINEYVNASNKHFSHYTRRQRKLLLNKREIKKLIGAVQRKGLTIVPIRMYFNDDGRVKLKISLAQGKAKHDKRETEKNRDWQRQKQRLLKER